MWISCGGEPNKSGLTICVASPGRCHRSTTAGDHCTCSTLLVISLIFVLLTLEYAFASVMLRCNKWRCSGLRRSCAAKTQAADSLTQ